jgi:hypothetical protein
MTHALGKSCSENKTIFFSEYRTVDEIMSKNLVDTYGPQITSQYGSYALHAG